GRAPGGDPIPLELRLRPLQRAGAGEGLLLVRDRHDPRLRAPVRAPDLHSRARAARDHLRLEPALEPADRARDLHHHRRPAAGGRPRDDDAGSDPRAARVRRLDRGRRLLRETVGQAGRSAGRAAPRVMYPKIELHVHLEGTVRAATLLEIARRNGYALPADTVEGLASLYEYRDFEHFIEIWVLTTNALRRREDFRQIVVDYAAEAAGHGAVYIEGIFSAAERVRRGVAWDDIYSGYCDGAEEARELYGVEIRLTPDIVRGFPLEECEQVARYGAAYAERGVVGVGLGGLEAQYPPEPYASVFELA